MHIIIFNSAIKVIKYILLHISGLKGYSRTEKINVGIWSQFHESFN